MPAPDVDELEVTILGPGIGESICVHLGEGNWIIVDSCKDPAVARPAPLAYLSSIGIDISSAVRLIVATHCDADHIFGLAEVVEAAPGAKLVLPGAFTERAFKELVASHRSVVDASLLTHFGDALAIIEGRNGSPIRAQANLSLPISGSTAQITALSPSPKEIDESLAWIATQQIEVQNRRQIRAPRPNGTSIALHIQMQGHQILLGADVENGTSPNHGWQAILTDHGAHTGGIGIFKVPHHGSPGAHEPRVWDWLHADAVTCMAAFSAGGRPLPHPDDVRRICSVRGRSYATSLPSNSEFERLYGLNIQKIAASCNVNVKRQLSRFCGRVTTRWKIGSAPSQITVDLDKGARAICAFDPGMHSSALN